MTHLRLVGVDTAITGTSRRRHGPTGSAITATIWPLSTNIRQTSLSASVNRTVAIFGHLEGTEAATTTMDALTATDTSAIRPPPVRG